MNKLSFSRRSIRLEGYDYSLPGGYFVTIVTRGRKCLFGSISGSEMEVSSLGRIVLDCWEAIPAHFPGVGLDVFMVMPNHIHGIVVIYEDSGMGTPNIEKNVGAQYIAPLRAQHAAPLRSSGNRGVTPHVTPGSLGAIIRSCKAAVSRRAEKDLDLHDIWQRNYYEHILRSQTDYENIAEYILDNPRNWSKDEVNPGQALPK